MRCAVGLVALFVVLLSTEVRAQTWNELLPFMDQDELLVIRDLQRAYATDALPPDETARWQTVALPDFWLLDRRYEHQHAWYRTTFTVDPERSSTWAIFVPRISAWAQFWVNGQLVGENARLTEPLPNGWNHPTLVTFPAGTLQRQNTLHVRLVIDPSRTGTLYELYVAPLESLSLVYKASFFAKVTMAQTLTISMLLVAFFIGVLCVMRQQPRSYVWFMWGSLAWAIYSVHLHLLEIPFDVKMWHGLHNTARAVAPLCFVIAAHRMLELKRAYIEIPGWLACAVVVWCSVRFSVVDTSIVTTIATFVSVVLSMYLGLILTSCAWWYRHASQRWLAVPGVLLLALLIYDYTSVVWQATSLFAKYPYAPLVAIVSGAMLFVSRMVRADRDLQALQTEQVSVAEAAAKAERARLRREIHDGVGGQLASTLSMVERAPQSSEEVATALRASLTDLRLIINSLESMGQERNLVNLLAGLRERLERQLQPHDVDLHWDVHAVPDFEQVDEGHSLHIMRIVQESIANVLKHADASYVTLRCGEAEGNAGSAGVFVEIVNDGVLPGDTRADEGQGLRNLQERATELGGEFGFTRDDATGIARLWIPLAGRADGAP